MSTTFSTSPSLLFTSESVTEGHPDKMCDQISDAVLDAHLAGDAKSRVACETMVKTGFVAIAEFDGFMRTGRGAAGHRGAAKAAIVEQNIDLDRGITPRIENFAGVDIDDRGHGAGTPGKGVVIG